jgi:cytochrome c oxidase cbb3-type subunit 3
MSTKDSKQDRLLDHNYDGIQEYDNPMPAWWVWIFWATILFALLYWINVPGIGSGKGRIAQYEAEVERAQALRAAAEQAAGPVTDELLFALAKDPAKVEAGRAVFAANCVPCHREDGGGSIGPNLTDDYWIHGGRPVAIHNTVDKGVLDKGMLAWGQTLKPDELNAVVAYVLTLHGTDPKDPKEPQGTKEEEADEADSD